MTAWIDAFLPTFGLIGLGVALKRLLIRDAAVWAGIEALIFWVLLPCLLAASIASVDLASLPLGAMAATIWITLLVGTVAAMRLARSLGYGHAAMTSIVQGGIRFNNYVAFAIGAGLYGQAGLAFGGVVAGLIVPGVQVILTLVFALGGERRPDPLRVLRGIATNPLLLGCLAGFLFAAFGGMPPGIAPAIRSLGQSSVALGLLCVGAGLSPGALREAPATQVAVALQKLVAMPLLTLGLARLLGLPPAPAAIAILFMAMPTAVTAYVMARAMGGDPRLMAAMITLQHLAAVATLPVWALVLGA